MCSSCVWCGQKSEYWIIILLLYLNNIAFIAMVIFSICICCCSGVEEDCQIHKGPKWKGICTEGLAADGSHRERPQSCILLLSSLICTLFVIIGQRWLQLIDSCQFSEFDIYACVFPLTWHLLGWNYNFWRQKCWLWKIDARHDKTPDTFHFTQLQMFRHLYVVSWWKLYII